MSHEYPAWVQPADVLHCEAPGCSHVPDRIKKMADSTDEPTPRFAVRGANLCRWHIAQLARVLEDLAGLHGDVEQAAYARTITKDTYARAADGAGVRPSSGIPADAGASWNPHAAVVLHELNDWTGYLVRMVNRDHPTDVVSEVVRPSVQLTILGSRYADWWGRYPSIGNYILADALLHRRNALKALDSSSVRRFTLRSAFCTEIVAEDPDTGLYVQCGAPLAAVLRPAARDDAGVQREASRSEILCSANPRHPQLPRESWMQWEPIAR